MVDKLEAVTQTDREAAAAMLEAYRDRLTNVEQAESAMLAVNIRAGLYDEAPRVQAFARHRLASATPANGEQVERLEAEIARLRGLLIDPGSPAWEDTRAVLAAELRKAEMPNHARAVEQGEGPYIPSHIALNLITHARQPTPTEDARSRVLEEAAKVADDHGAAWVEHQGFANVIATAIRALGNKETDRHG